MLPSSLSHCKCIMSIVLRKYKFLCMSCVMRKLIFGCSDQVLGVLTIPKAIIQPQKIALDLEIWVNKRYRH